MSACAVVRTPSSKKSTSLLSRVLLDRSSSAMRLRTTGTRTAGERVGRLFRISARVPYVEGERIDWEEELGVGERCLPAQSTRVQACFDAGCLTPYTGRNRVRLVDSRAAAHTTDTGEGSWPRD